LMPEKFRSPDEQTFLQHYEFALDDFIANIFVGLSEQQKANLASNLGKYISDFQGFTL
jgi:hypothetical protein